MDQLILRTQMPTNDKELLLAKLNQETAVISFRSLQRFYAQGRVLVVCTDLDLVNIAADIASDQSAMIEQRIKRQQIAYLTDQQARLWLKNNENIWALVVSPWVLVQPRKSG